MLSSVLGLSLLISPIVLAINFPYERVQLHPLDVGNNSDIFFGDGTSTKHPACKSYPGYDGWPSSERWTALNTSLGGALLSGIPPAAACYEGKYKNTVRCNVVRSGQYNAVFA
jgi:hypothetical protein